MSGVSGVPGVGFRRGSGEERSLSKFVHGDSEETQVVGGEIRSRGGGRGG